MRYLIPLLVAGLALPACGSGASTNSPTSEDKAFDGAVKFAQCMREHGLDFPDPQRDANGMVRIGGPNVELDPKDPKVRDAHKDCEKHLDGGGRAPSAAEQAEFQDAFLRYARCMRGEGVDVPDPKAGSGGLLMHRDDPDAPDLESPKFKAADAQCRKHLAELAPPRQEQSP